MTDDTTHQGDHHVPTPAEVRAEHPTVLVPVPPSDDEVRRLEPHEDEAQEAHEHETHEHEAVASDAPTHADPTVASSDSPFLDLDSSAAATAERESTESLAQLIADTASTVSGVHALGSTASRAVDSARTRLLGRTSVPGVNVLEDRGTLAVGVSLVAEYPANVIEVADSVRAEVADALMSRHTGSLDIDVTVTDVHGPFDPIEPDPGEAMDKAAAALGDAKDRTGTALSDASARAAEAAAAASDRAGAALSEGRDRVGSAIDDAKDRTATALDDVRRRTGDAVDAATARTADALDDAADSLDDAARAHDEDTSTDAGSEFEADPIEVDDRTESSDASADMSEAASQLAEAADALAAAAESVADDADRTDLTDGAVVPEHVEDDRADDSTGRPAPSAPSPDQV